MRIVVSHDTICSEDLTYILEFDALAIFLQHRYRSGQYAHLMLSTLGTQIFLLRLFYLLKEQKRVLDLLIFRPIGKTTEKLQ